MKKIMELANKHKVEIIVGIVSCFIWMIIQNILEGIPAMGKGFMKFLSDLPYRAASISLEDMSFGILMSLAIYAAFGIAVASLMANLFAVLKARGLIKQVRSDVQNPERARVAIKGAKKPQDLEECISELQEVSRKTFVTSAIKVLFTVFCCVVLYLACVKPINMRISFANAIKIITPYTDEHTIDKLESDWALMQTREDYMEIDKVITEIRDNNRLW